MNSKTDRYILYADDDQEDQEALKEIIGQGVSDVTLVTVNTGIELIEYLNSLHSGDFLPCLILLDLNMPQISGIETLRRLKEDKLFSRIPVIIFSTANRDSDVAFAKSLGAKEYIRKPFNLETFKAISNNLIDHCEIIPEQKR